MPAWLTIGLPVIAAVAFTVAAWHGWKDRRQ